jgi:hypothetical protein
MMNFPYCELVYIDSEANLEGGVRGVRPAPPKIRKAYVIQRYLAVQQTTFS